MFRALILVAAFSALPAHAQVTEIFKCKSADGHWPYTNDRREGERQKCEVVTRQINVAPAQKPPPAPPRNAAAKDFPRETPQDSANAKARQRDILEKELAQEQQALAKAKADLAGQENVRFGNERNYARVEERLQPFKDSVETHEKNIEALRRELGNLR